MKEKTHCFSLFALTLYLISFPSLVFADERKVTLQGIESFMVTVNPLPPEIEKAGLTVGILQNDVELKLRLAGIKLVPLNEAHKLPGRPLLGIHLNIIKTQLQGYVCYIYSIQANFYQAVYLVRNPKIIDLASTWAKDVIGISHGPQKIRNSLKGLVDFFINDYLSENPK